MIRHVLLCNTPYHLLVAGSIVEAEGIVEEAEVLAYPGRILSPPIRQALEQHVRVRGIDSTGPLLSAAVRLRGKLEWIYLGNDYNSANQVFAGLTGARLAVFEDGIAAYLPEPSLVASVRGAQRFKRLLNAVAPSLLFNLRGQNGSSAERRFALRGNAFPFIDDRRLTVVPLLEALCDALVQSFGLDDAMLRGADALYVSQCMAEYDFQDRLEPELRILERLVGQVSGRLLLFKPHPLEKPHLTARRVEFFRKLYERVEIIGPAIPVEAFAHRLDRSMPVYSICSTVLLTLATNYGLRNVSCIHCDIDTPQMRQVYALLAQFGVNDIAAAGSATRLQA